MIQFMNVEELQQKISSNDDFILIDCRETDEWNSGHIEQAQLIPLSTFQEGSKALESSKDKTIVIQCRSGKRSLTACQMLLAEGYTKLYNLEGGILAWVDKSYPVIEE